MGSKLETCFRSFRTWLAACALVAVTAAPALAQSGSIVGTLTDQSSGAPIPNVQVQVVTAAGRVAGSTTSNDQGRFQVTSLSPGTYSVALSHVNYGDSNVEGVVVSAGQATTVTRQLQVRAFQHAQITVTGVKGGEAQKIVDSPNATDVADQRSIELRPTPTMVDHAKQLRGVDVTHSGIQSSNVVVRGFNNIFSGALHMLTDHRLASIPSLRVNFMHFVPQTNEDLQRMEVVLGPASALYGGNTANGVLHMITKSPFDEQKTTLTFTGGERSLMHVTGRTAHKLSESLGFKVSGQFVRADDWPYVDPVEEQTRLQANDPDPTRRALFRAAQPLGPNGQPLPADELERRIALIGVRDNDINRWSADARVDWRATDNATAIFAAGRSVSATGVELTGIGAGQVKDWAYSYYQGRFHLDRLFAQAYLNTSNAGDTYLLRNGLPIVDRSKLFAAQLQHGLTMFDDRQRFTYGADYTRTMPDTEGTIHGIREDDDTTEEWGVYLQSSTRLTNQLDLVFAGRADDHSRLPEMVFSPRAALVFKPTENQSLRATYNRAFSTPSSLNLYLDIDAGWAGTAIGPMGFRARAFGAGESGIRFRNPEGGLFGMRSPSAAAVGGTPGQMMPVNARNLYRLQIENFLRVAGAAGAQIAPLLRSFQADPTLPQAIVALDPLTNAMFDPAQVQDVPGIRESTTETFEVGYTRRVLNKLDLAVDVWRERKKNFTSPLIVQSPLLLMQPQQLAGYLVPRLTLAFVAAGMPPAQAQATATAVATQIVRVPGAVVTSPDVPATASDLIATYRNYGEVKLWGIDVGAAFFLTETLQISGTASFVSDDHFRLELDGVPQFVTLNAPSRKANLALTYRNPDNGFNGELRVRHNSEFPVNSAGYVGMSGCVDHDFGGAIINEPCVESFNIVDVLVGYDLPQIRGASLQLLVQNALDEDYRAFVGTPTLGRLMMLRLKYDF